LSQKAAALFSVIKTGGTTIKPMPVGNLWDDFTWPVIHLFDIIRVHHSEETEDFFSIAMTELVKSHYRKFGIKSLQISRTLEEPGRLPTNILNSPSFRSIKRAMIKS
jgi:hypothetical protein